MISLHLYNSVRDHEKKHTNAIMIAPIVGNGKVFGNRSAKMGTPRRQIAMFLFPAWY